MAKKNARERALDLSATLGKTDVIAATAIADAKREMNRARAEGKNVRIAEEMLKRAERAYKDKNFDKALGFAKASVYKIEPAKYKADKENASEENEPEKGGPRTLSTPHWIDRGKTAKRGYVILFFNALIFAIVGLAIFSVGQLYHAILVYLISLGLLLVGIYARKKLRDEYSGWSSKCFDTDVEGATKGIERLLDDMKLKYRITGPIKKSVLPFFKPVEYEQSFAIDDGTHVRIMELPIGVSIYVGRATLENIETVEKIKHELDNAYLGKNRDR